MGFLEPVQRRSPGRAAARSRWFQEPSRPGPRGAVDARADGAPDHHRMGDIAGVAQALLAREGYGAAGRSPEGGALGAPASEAGLALNPAPPQIQRTCAGAGDPDAPPCHACEACQAKSAELQRHADGSGAGASPGARAGSTGASARATTAVSEALRSSGQPLDAAARATFEPYFGYDFGSVRVHSDGSAADSARAVHAPAYTVGRDIVFGHGRYAPGTEPGRRLLAHELAHVVQQRSAQVAPGQHLAVGPEHDEHERQADAAARHATAAARAPAVGALGQARVQRLGFFSSVARLFGFEAGELSEEDLTSYLDDIAARKACDCGFFSFLSDDKARAIANQGGVGKYRLDQAYKGLASTSVKRILIQEMLSGPTTGPDEHAIIKVLADSAPEDVRDILNPARGLSVQQLRDDIGGDNLDRLLAVLDQKLPDLGKEHLERTPKPGAAKGACTPDRALEIDHAQKRAQAAVTHAIEQLDQYRAKPGDFAHVGGLLACHFSASDMKVAARVRDTLSRMSGVLAQQQYRCPDEPFTGFTVNQKDPKTGESMGSVEIPCDPETAAVALQTRGAGPRQVVLCPDFFELSGRAQASSVVHESFHHAVVPSPDVKYGGSCQALTTDQALHNADSFAFFVMKLETEGVVSKSEDCPLEDREKLLQASRTAQTWVNRTVALLADYAAAPRGNHPAAAQVQRHFKISSESLEKGDAAAVAALGEVRRGFREIQAAFGGELPFQCDAGSEDSDTESVPARTITIDPFGITRGLFDVHFMPAFFALDDDTRAVTVVHEMAHRFPGKLGEVYMILQHAAYGRLTTTEALENADSYAQLARFIQPRGPAKDDE